MKILYLCTDPGIPVLGKKGASVHVREIVASFEGLGHSVQLSTPSLNRTWEEAEKFEGMLLHLQLDPASHDAVLSLKEFNEMIGVENVLPRHIRRILYNQEIVRRLSRKFKKHPPDFIYERASLFSIAGVLLSRKLNVPLLIELNAPLAEEQSIYRGAGLGELATQTEFWSLSRADAVLTVSDQLRTNVISQGVETNKVHVIPNGVNSQLFFPGKADPETRKSWGLRKGTILGFVGGLRPWHGVKILPHLLDRLARKCPDIQMAIVGEGPLRRELEDDFKERNLEKNVVFTGSVSHSKVASLISHFDIALAPYPQLDHAFYFSPLKLFEYMACGIPVVASDTGQIGKVIRNGETGFLYPPGSLEDLINACEKLLADTELRRSVGQAASEEIHKNYTWDHNATRIIELARSLISKREVQK